MEFYLFCIILCYILRNCDGHGEILILNGTASERFCAPPFKDIQTSTPVVFLIADNDSNVFLSECLLIKRSVGFSIMVLSDKKHLHSISINKKLVKYGNLSPIIVVVINNLNPEIIYHPAIKYLFKSHQCTVYIEVTTRDTKYGCDEGVFEDEVFKTIDDFLNQIWHEYKIFVVIVEFPFVCPEYFVIYNDKRPSEYYDVYDRTITTISTNTPNLHKKLFINSLRSLTNGYPLRANIFQRFPTSIYECQNIHYYLKVDEKYTNGMCGMDAFVMHDMLRYYQFNLTFPEITDIDSYGFAFNNTVTGSLGSLLRDEFDISFNSRFLVRYLEDDKIIFLHFVSFDSICAVLKNPDLLPLWYYTYNCLKPSTWLALLSLIALCSAINKIFELIRRSMGKHTTSSNIIDLLAIGMFGCYFNKRIKASILGGICLLISLICYALFQGHVNYMYTTLVSYSRIKTLHELHNSNIKIYTSKSFYTMIGPDFQSRVVQNSKKKTGDVLTNSRMAVLQRKNDVTLQIRRDFSDGAGNPMMYLVKECYCNNVLSYITKRDFPFITELKVFMMTLLEAGLPEAYYRFTQNALELATVKTFHSQRTAARPFIPSDMAEFRIAFCLLCVGYIVSTGTLVIERWWATKRSREIPNTRYFRKTYTVTK